MKAVGYSFIQMIRQMTNDAILSMITLAPFLIGALFKLVIPIAESLLTEYWGVSQVLSPYYKLLDALLIMITPSMFNYTAAMIMLEEIDDHISSYLSVTPLGKTGYLFSRFGCIGAVSVFVSIIVALIFSLSKMEPLMLIGSVFAGTLQGSMAALLIVSLSKNKVEGMAVGKFASLLSMGALAPYFIDTKAQFAVSFLPSFWIGKAVRTNAYYPVIVAVLLSFVWLAVLSGKFMKKVS